MTGPDAYEERRIAASAPVYSRVYRPAGRYAHLRTEDGFADVLCRALKYRYISSSWLGTGNQAEYDQAAGMPLCPDCFCVRERQLPDDRLGAGHQGVLA
jgi:hypothetical protein